MSHFRTPPLATSRALDAAMALSARLQMVAITLLLLMSVQFVVASCTPEPVPYASRVLIER